MYELHTKCPIVELIFIECLNNGYIFEAPLSETQFLIK